MDLKRGLEKGLKVVVEELKNRSKKVETQTEIAQVATILACVCSEHANCANQGANRLQFDRCRVAYATFYR